MRSDSLVRLVPVKGKHRVTTFLAEMWEMGFPGAAAVVGTKCRGGISCPFSCPSRPPRRRGPRKGGCAPGLTWTQQGVDPAITGEPPEERGAERAPSRTGRVRPVTAV
ncbi:hypothetical protein GCM10023192_62870 [Amycolatopsis samaneae]